MHKYFTHSQIAVGIIFLLAYQAQGIEAPDVVINAYSDFHSTHVDLNWQPIPGANNYRVYRLEPDTVLIGVTSSTTFSTAVPTGWTFQTPTRTGNFLVIADNNAGMIHVPSGYFMMGDSSDDTSYSPDDHQVTLTSDFLLGKNEVTNAEFIVALQWAFDHGLVAANQSSVMAYGLEIVDLDAGCAEIAFNGDQFVIVQAPLSYEGFPGGYDPTNHPVKIANWYGAACYCDWISISLNLDPFYNGVWDQSIDHNPYNADGFRLPTEAEWEYAAVYDDDRMYPWGDSAPNCNTVNFEETSFTACVRWSAPVGSCPDGRSALGFQDMAGNVWEYVGDRGSNNTTESSINPLGPNTGSNRGLRGGSYHNEERDIRCARQQLSLPSYVTDGLRGFRICRTAD